METKKCSNCSFCLLKDYGYSNWTVDGTNSVCRRGKRPTFDVGWNDDNENDLFAQECSEYFYGQPLKRRVEDYD